MWRQDILHRACRQEPSRPEAKRIWESLVREAAESQVASRIRIADKTSFSDRIGVKWRPNFKLQFFRVSEPAAPNWIGADPPGTTDSFAYTGAPLHQQIVWQNVYDWMKGEARAGITRSHLSDAEVNKLSTFLHTLDTVADEPQRIGSAYGTSMLSAWAFAPRIA